MDREKRAGCYRKQHSKMSGSDSVSSAAAAARCRGLRQALGTLYWAHYLVEFGSRPREKVGSVKVLTPLGRGNSSRISWNLEQAEIGRSHVQPSRIQDDQLLRFLLFTSPM